MGAGVKLDYRVKDGNGFIHRSIVYFDYSRLCQSAGC